MNNILSCTNITKKYGNKVALDNVSFEIQQGRIVGLLGPNGAGKTTIMKIIAGLLTINDGEINVCGKKIGVESKKIVSYLSDKENCFSANETVLSIIHFYSQFYEDFNINRANEMINNLKIDPKTKYKDMSKGTKEKVRLIMIMSRDAMLYVLDEPIGGVDPSAREYIIKTILQCYNEKASILISTHLIADIENVLDDAIIIKEGKIIENSSVEQLREKHNMSLEEIFKEEFRCY